jgi:hypothetical protein
MYNIFHSIICELSKIKFHNDGFKPLVNNLKFQRYGVLDFENEDEGLVPEKQLATLTEI